MQASSSQLNLIESNQQLNQRASALAAASGGGPYDHVKCEAFKFGAEMHPNSFQANQNAFLGRFDDSSGAAFQFSISAHRSPLKPGSPATDDLAQNEISLVANRGKPATPIVTSSNWPMIQSCEVNWATDALLPELTAVPETMETQGKALIYPNQVKIVKGKELQDATKVSKGRGKFLTGRRKGEKRLFEVADILTNLPKTETRAPQCSKLAQREQQQIHSRVRVAEQVTKGDFQGGALPQNEIQIASAVLPARTSRRVARLRGKANKLKSSGSDGAYSPVLQLRARYAGPSLLSRNESAKASSKRQVVAGRAHQTRHQITKMRRTQVKYQQGRQKYLQQLPGSSQQQKYAPNVINTEHIGDTQVQAFLKQQVSSADSEGLWQMEKEHIYSQGHSLSISPDHNLAEQPSSRLRSQSRTPPSRNGHFLGSAADAQPQPIQNDQNMLGSAAAMSGMRSVSRSASSAAERELFEIFSGLKVVTMRASAAALPVATSNFEGNGGSSAMQSYPSRPYRWLPTQLPSQAHPTRLSSV